MGGLWRDRQSTGILLFVVRRHEARVESRIFREVGSLWAGVTVLALTWTARLSRAARGKFLAAFSLGCWFGALTAGRLMAYVASSSREPGAPASPAEPLSNHRLCVRLGLLVASLLKKSADLQQASFVVFFLLGLVAIPAYLTGSAAQIVLQNQPGVSQELMAAHQDAAMLALILMEITGLVAWIALVAVSTVAPDRCPGSLDRDVRADGTGRQYRRHIRHPEILAAGTAASAPGWPRTAAAGAAFVLDHPWVWPICEVFHFVGLCLLFGVSCS